MKTALVATAVLIPTLLWAADHLNVKTGLWEIATSTAMGGASPFAAGELDKLPPERRARVLAAIQSQMSGAHTHTSHSCITEEDLNHPFHGMDDKNCKVTSIKTTSNTQDVTTVCGAPHPSTSKIHFEAVSPELVTGTMQINMAGPNGEMTVNGQIKGQWVKSACKKGEDD